MVAQASAAGPDIAAIFGAREAVRTPALSPDGSRILYLAADAAAGESLMVAPSDGSAPPKAIASASGIPTQLQDCDWADDHRIVCTIYDIDTSGTADVTLLGVRRLIALDDDGRHQASLGQRQSIAARLRMSNDDGIVIDWREGKDGKLLIERDHVPEQQLGTHLASSDNGYGVDLVDTRSLAASKVEQADPTASSFLSDGMGVVRMKSNRESNGLGILRPNEHWAYRILGDRTWRPFSTVTENDQGLRPISVDGRANVAYCLMKKDGRDALYRVSLDGSMKTDPVYADPHVDVEDTIRVGREARLIGVKITADTANATYFDSDYAALSKALSKALPHFPIVNFVSASADESKLLLFAGSDIDPGRYYVFDRQTKHLNELMLTRPRLEHAALSTMKSVSYTAADGTAIPAFLSLPPGGPTKGRPAIVMPHGGPASHDDWGFDWLVQFYTARGFAVLQPEYRGSTGYGDAWQMQNGFKSWRVAIGDVVDAGRWLVAQGIADPQKLAIVGWSYGGYAALESQVLDPKLFKAVVAIAPVTDLDALKAESSRFTNDALARNYIGNIDTDAASPARHAAVFEAPVLMFHGTLDMNVGVAETRSMNDRLRAAGKQSQAIIYPGLDHQLPSSEIRADMLRRSDAFLRASLHLAN